MITQSIDRLQFLCDTIPSLLMDLEEHNFSAKSSPEKWSKKEIIGHLIDSATNNHHRFVRGQFEEIPKITYDQNQWNTNNHYQQIDRLQIISFWASYNKQLLALIKLLPKEKLQRIVNTGGEKTHTLVFFNRGLCSTFRTSSKAGSTVLMLSY